MFEVTVGSKLDTSIVRIDLKRKRIHSRGRIVEYLNTISPIKIDEKISFFCQ